MKRILAISYYLLIIISIVCSCKHYPAPNWFTERANLSHTGSVNDSIKIPLSIRWTVKLPKSVRSSIIGGKDMIFVGCDDSLLYSLDPTKGTILWKYHAYSKISATPTYVGGNKEREQYIWFVAEDGSLTALNAGNGSYRWRLEGGNLATNSSTNYYSREIYYVYSYGAGSRLRCVNSSTGSIIWESEAFNNSVAAPMFGAGNLYLGIVQVGDVFWCLQPVNGNLIWKIPGVFTINNGSYTSGIYDSNVGINNPERVILSVTQDTLVCYSAIPGQRLWTTLLKHGYEVIGLALTQEKPRNILVVTQNHYTYGIDPGTGSIIWNSSHEGNLVDLSYTRITPQPAILGDYVFVIENAKDLVARKVINGEQVWKYTLDTVVLASPTVGGQSVYISTLSGNVYAFSGQ